MEGDTEKKVTPACKNPSFKTAFKWKSLWIPITGFFLFSPGLILTIPPNGFDFKYLFFSMKTNFWAIVIHTLLFGAYLVGMYYMMYAIKSECPEDQPADWLELFSGSK